MDEQVELNEQEIDSQLIQSLDEMFLLMMRFTKNQILKESVQDSMITPPQFGMLWCLSQCGEQNMKDLAERMDLSHGAATGLVDRLHKLGLVDRHRLDSDRRVVCARISAAGHALIQRINQRRHQILKNILQQLTTEEHRFMLRIHSIVKDKLSNYVE